LGDSDDKNDGSSGQVFRCAVLETQVTIAELFIQQTLPVELIYIFL
jgi:hypothetical protein